MMENEILYSHIEDDWRSCDVTIEEVAQMLIDETPPEEIKDRKITLYKGEKKPQEFGRFFCVDDMLESVRESALDEFGEYAESFLEGVNDEQKRELRDLVVEWAAKHNLDPDFYEIQNIEPVVFEIPSDWELN